MTGMVMSDLPVEREVLFEYYVDRHQRMRLLYRIVVEELVYYGLDCIEALKFGLLAEQGGDVAVSEASPVVVSQVEGNDLYIVDVMLLKYVCENITS